MKSKNYAAIVVVVLCLFSNSLFAVLMPPYIHGSSTATLLDSGDYAGMYLYEIDVVWNLGGCAPGLSHWDLILKQGCADLDHLIWFDSPAGFSTSEDHPSNPLALGWTGYLNRVGDPSIDIVSPVIKYDEPFDPEDDEPASSGYGTFCFYSNIVPEYGVYQMVLVTKAGHMDPTFGELQGAYPSCTIIPEPATILLLGLGSSFLFVRKK